MKAIHPKRQFKTTANLPKTPDWADQFFDSPEFLRIWIPNRTVSKLRPRLSRHSQVVHLHDTYRKWKTETVALLWAELRNPHKLFDLTKCMASRWQLSELPITPAQVGTLFVGGMPGDPDNRLGAINDCLIDAGILANDTVTHNPAGKLESVKSSTYKGTLILIQPCTHIKFQPKLLIDWRA